MVKVLEQLMQHDKNVMQTFEKVFREVITLPKIVDDLITTMFESKSSILE